jgi:hypothetical protein
MASQPVKSIARSGLTPLFPVRYQGKFGEVPSITLAVAEEMSETNSIERAFIGENE